MENVYRATSALHKKALERLRARVVNLGFNYADLNLALRWIQWQAPIIIHVDLARFGKLLAQDTHYRNQFETHESNGCLDYDRRAMWGKDLFGDAYKDAIPFQRCKYGVINLTNDPQGVQKASSQYGLSFFELRGVRSRTTITPSDSATLPISKVGTLGLCAHVLQECTDKELEAALMVGTKRTSYVSSEVVVPYKEAQVHGAVCLSSDIERIVVHASLRGEAHAWMLRQLSQTCSAEVRWMDDSVAHS
jgi:hypothetical protein